VPTTTGRARGRQGVRSGTQGAVGEHTSKIMTTLISGVVVIGVALVMTKQGRDIDAATQHFMLFYAGVFALIGLTASVGVGLVATDRIVMTPGHRVMAQAVHRAVSFGALAFLIIHIVTEILAQRSHVIDAFIPFLSPYRTFYIGLGTIASDLILLIVVTSIFRKRFTAHGKAWRWRAIHYGAYVAFVFGVLHGLLGGRTAKPYVDWSYGFAIALTALAVVVRFLAISLRSKDTMSAPPGADRAAGGLGYSRTSPLRSAALSMAQAQLSGAIQMLPATGGAQGTGLGMRASQPWAALPPPPGWSASSGPLPALSAASGPPYEDYRDPALMPLGAPVWAEDVTAGTGGYPHPAAPGRQPLYEPEYDGPPRFEGAPRKHVPQDDLSSYPYAQSRQPGRPDGSGPLPLGPAPRSGSGPMPRADTGPMPRAGTGPMPRLGTGPVPRADSSPMPRSDTGPMPRADSGPFPRPLTGPASGPMPRVDSGPFPRPVTGPASGPMPRLDTGPMPRVDTGPMPRLGTGPMPRLGTGAVPRADSGSTPRMDSSPMPRADSGPLHRADSSPLPRPGTGPAPRADSGPSPRPGSGPMARPGSGPMPRADTGPMPRIDTGPMPRLGTGPMPGPGTGPVPRADSGPMPRLGTGPAPRTGSGPTPRPGTGPAPRADSGPMPQPGRGPAPWPESGPAPRLVAGPVPRPDTGPMPRIDSGPMPRLGTGPMPRADSGPLPRLGPDPLRGTDSGYAPETGPVPRPGPGQNPRPGDGARSGPSPDPRHGPRSGSAPATATRRSRRTHAADPRYRDTPGHTGGDEWR
jgi:DMSO/TMAO reductase YedYZ heme-binding membrane subunit